MIDLFNNVLFLKWALFISFMIIAYLFYRCTKQIMLLDEGLIVTERLNSECDRLKDSVNVYKSKYNLIDESLEKAYAANASMREELVKAYSETEHLRLQLGKANVAAMPVRKPRRPRSRKPQSNGQA